VNQLRTTTFDLPAHLTAKADPALVARDEQHFTAIATSLDRALADLTAGSTRPGAPPPAPGSKPSTATRRCTG